MIYDHFVVPLEMNALTEEGTFEGHAALFDIPNEFDEIVLPGAFKRTLHKHPKKRIRMLRQHQQREIIGVWQKIVEDDKGLFVRGKLLTELSIAKESLILMKEGALDSLSIGFRTIKDQFNTVKKLRELIELQLFEISLVAIPAQLGALITSVRELGPDDILTKRDLENALRDAGFSDSASRYISAGWEPPAQRDAGGGYDDLADRISAFAKTVKTV